MDYQFLLKRSKEGFEKVSPVSILILMDYQFLQVRIKELENEDRRVSILILMDYQFLPLFTLMKKTDDEQFQSLF